MVSWDWHQSTLECTGTTIALLSTCSSLNCGTTTQFLPILGLPNASRMPAFSFKKGADLGAPWCICLSCDWLYSIRRKAVTNLISRTLSESQMMLMVLSVIQQSWNPTKGPIIQHSKITDCWFGDSVGALTTKPEDQGSISRVNIVEDYRLLLLIFWLQQTCHHTIIIDECVHAQYTQMSAILIEK